jgi:DNA-binding CsgD family transcriptional regulator
MQDLLAERLGICLVLVDREGREITLPSGLPLICNDHRECTPCHARYISQIRSASDWVIQGCPNGLHLAALETSIQTDEGSLYLLAGRTADRSQTECHVELLRAIFTLPFALPTSARKATAPAKGRAYDSPQSALTAQENKVLTYIVAGLPNKEIGAELCISQSTVKAHVASILKKLSLSNRTAASVYALKNGIYLGDQGV